MYYNQFLKHYVILSKNLDDLYIVDDFIQNAEKHADFMSHYHSITFNLDLLKSLKEVYVTDIGEYLFSKELIEQLKEESEIWLYAYLKYMNRKSNDYWADQKELITFLHFLMGFFHDKFNIGMHPKYIKRYLLTHN